MAMNLGFAKDTKYVQPSRNGNKISAPVRLTAKQYTNKQGQTSSYYEGAVQLSNGQWIWVSIGGQLIQKESKTGNVYMNARVSLTTAQSTRTSKFQ